MKLHLHPGQQAFSLCGFITGVMLLVVGVIVVVLLIRACKIPPRKLPPEAEDAMNRDYPGYYTNITMQTWPVHFVPWSIDLITPEPQAPIYEKVILADAFFVQVCKDGTFQNWETQFLWVIGDMSAATPLDCDVVYGSMPYDKDGVSYKMKKDFSGIDVDPSPDYMATNKVAFWKTTAYD